MSAPSPIPDDVQRGILRIGSSLGEMTLPARVAPSTVKEHRVIAVNDDGTLDVEVDGAVMQHVKATTACVGAEPDDTVIVERYGPRLYCVGVVAKSLDIAAYVISEFEPGFRAYSEALRPVVARSGGMASLYGSCAPTSTVPGSATQHEMFSVPEWARPARQLTTVCQGSSTAVWTMRVEPDGAVTMERYRKGDAYVDCGPDNWLGFSASWALA